MKGYDVTKCYKCKIKKAECVMSDKEITKGRFRGFCRGCYDGYFKEKA